MFDRQNNGQRDGQNSRGNNDGNAGDSTGRGNASKQRSNMMDDESASSDSR